MRHPDIDVILEYLRMGDFTLQCSVNDRRWHDVDGEIETSIDCRYRKKPITAKPASQRIHDLYRAALVDSTIEWEVKFRRDGEWRPLHPSIGFQEENEYREVPKFAVGDHVQYYLCGAGEAPFIVQVQEIIQPYDRNGSFIGLVVQSNPGQWHEGFQGPFYYHQFSKEQ